MGDGKVCAALCALSRYADERPGSENRLQGEVFQITPEPERQQAAIKAVWPQQTGEDVRRDGTVQCAGFELSCRVDEVSDDPAESWGLIKSGDWVKRALEFWRVASNIVPALSLGE
jgi:hypothetical protein